jgi:gamma-glutamyltranspeptidase/glutathione hydrolase
MTIPTISHGMELAQSATRPVIRGRHLVVSCGHYLAAVAGMRMLSLGGNAVDAGVAMVFAQSVLEFQSYGFGGEVPILIYAPREGRVIAINGNMTAPAAATIEWFRAKGISMIPGDGFLPAGVCAVPDALITALARYGRLTLGDVLAPAIELAANGFPMYETMHIAITRLADRFRREWPGSAALFLPDDRAPVPGETWRNPDLARTFEKLVAAEHDTRAHGRDRALRAARDRFYTGDIARDIVAYQRETRLRDANGTESTGLLTEEDFAAFETRIEAPVTVNYRGYDVYKCGPWTQGPAFLQALNILEGLDLRALGLNSADYVHTVLETLKLVFADRDQFYGDPECSHIPLRGLLSKEYAAKRRGLIDLARANTDVRPGDPYPYEGGIPEAPVAWTGTAAWAGGTTGTRAVDADGLMFSATPSGGWFRDSPVIPGLGFCLGTRGQMFRLDDPDHPAALRPRSRPRTTLTPSLVMKDAQPYMVFGTPGGDQQEQWTLQFFLNHVDFGLDVQDAIDVATFHTGHLRNSFYPCEVSPGKVVVEDRLPRPVVEALEARGHNVEVVAPWTLNFTTAIVYHAGKSLIEGGASSRGERSYALGW